MPSRQGGHADPAGLPRLSSQAVTESGPSSTSTPAVDTDPTHQPAAWKVPMGVRTASEWAWRSMVVAAAVLAALWLFAYLSTVTIPIIVAILLAALLRPVTQRLDRIMPTGLAAGLTVIGTFALIIGILSFVGSQFTSQFSDISSQVGQGIDQIRDWFRSTFGITDTQVQDWIATAREQLSSGSGNLGQTATKAGLTVSHTIAGFFISLFALFFFLYEGERIWAWVVRLFPRAARERVHSSGIIAWGQLSAFTRATILVAAADALGIGLIAALLGVPFASGVAILVFFGAFIPVIGALISGAVPVLLALVALGPVKALLMLGGVILVQQMESHILQPFLLGRAVRVHPLAVILGIAAGVVVAGIVGALIAVPTIAVLNAVGHHLLDGSDLPDTAEEMLTLAERERTRDETEQERRLAEEELQDKAPGS
ncbi:putative PurR-regulated permease PerM [Knoellia remsis]|uniref:Putative PurR-regulated permease PerM n=2 Tax=Knoellia remsis TaxID=407159 RepID=A0A2T0U6K6_9MICO|nr:putative PurR-regulated permease PerM [Knoellia remsis]